MALTPVQINSEAQKFVKMHKIHSEPSVDDARAFVNLPSVVQLTVLDKLPLESRIVLSSSLSWLCYSGTGPSSDKAKQLIKYKEEPQFKGFTIEQEKVVNGKVVHFPYHTYGMSHIILGSGTDGGPVLRVFC